MMNVLTTTDVPLDTLAAEIKARIEAGDRAADSHQATKRIGGSLRGRLLRVPATKGFRIATSWP